MEPYFDKSQYYIKEIDKASAKKLIVNNHYSHKWTMCSVALGVFKNGVVNTYINIIDDKLIGCIVYGNPIGMRASNSISPLIKQGQVYELTRLWLEDGQGKNIESYTIGESFKWLRIHKPHIKALISYADPSYGHIGRIYQATNWLYIKSFQAGNPLISFVDKPYKWVHAKTVHGLYGTNVPQKLADIKGQPIWAKRTSKKHKYLYILTDKFERKQILKTLKYPPVPYPKLNDYTEPDIKCFYPQSKNHIRQ